MKLKRSMLYCTIWSYLSPESIDAIKNQVAFKVFGVDKDSEGLWQIIVTTHRINCISHVPVVVISKLHEVAIQSAGKAHLKV
jgi:predicted ATP-dependent endonuclease of OLD family